ncbi:MAG: hypothetical protein U0821_01880 [Chloroflexota bacterium]
MNEQLVWNRADEIATRRRVAHGALRQAARHEHAVEACLGELGGYDAPTMGLVASVLRRVRRHADRAEGLAQMASRINRDPEFAPVLVEALHRQRGLRARIEAWCDQNQSA